MKATAGDGAIGAVAIVAGVGCVVLGNWIAAGLALLSVLLVGMIVTLRTALWSAGKRLGEVKREAKVLQAIVDGRQAARGSAR